MILASGSPRRRDLLGRLGMPFDVVISAEPERGPHADEPPHDYARAIALDKARAVSRQCPDAVVIAGDTIVVAGSTILGKPRDEDDALRMLTLLAGRVHHVTTGVAVICRGVEHVSSETTYVTMHEATQAMLRTYIESGEPMDKAGAYAIQGKGADLVAGFDGCLENVIGLPLCVVADLLARCGVQAVSTVCSHRRSGSR